jgi:23S rRNA (uridine2552-2'-O)-methyltransferase
MSRRWLTERKNDPYHKRAKEEGYRSRSAYKLKQMDDRFHFFRGARYVLDIGAAPGGWLQVASEAVGEDGLVVGVDQNPIEYLELENVETIVGDILEEETLDEIRELLPGSVDVVLSDLAPNISGAWEVDQFLQIDLARMALKISQDLLRRDGWSVVKAFMGPEYEAYPW